MRRAVLLSVLLAVAPEGFLKAQVDPLREELQAEHGRIQNLWRQKNFEEGFRILAARATSDSFAKLSPDVRAGVHYNMACAAALLGRTGEALACLGEAVGSGFGNWANLSTDPDLDSLRKEPGFRWLADTVRRRGDHLAILRRFAAYSLEPQAQPAFTYQPAEAPELVQFRQNYKLQELAGGGSEFTRAVRLMHWVHRQVRHDGTSKNPEPVNGPSLLEACRKEARGLNCYMMAVILNEACLSLGIKSRMVRCSPLNEQDPDCHVVNAIWSGDHGKWLYLDPTNDAWVGDEKGIPLSPQELRERLITGRPVQISDGANWNGKPLVPSQYLDYMAKNLVRISCPLASAFGHESRRSDQRPYVTLDALALDRPTREQGGGPVVKDPAAFWARP
ncbi:MAG: transglutaminase domain-containing protein [Acidobacteria bacterium]|nr:transglutaminase domain-containing protein [Acidobacteriota bacterium]